MAEGTGVAHARKDCVIAALAHVLRLDAVHVPCLSPHCRWVNTATIEPQLRPVTARLGRLQAAADAVDDALTAQHCLAQITAAAAEEALVPLGGARGVGGAMEKAGGGVATQAGLRQGTAGDTRGTEDAAGHVLPADAVNVIRPSHPITTA